MNKFNLTFFLFSLFIFACNTSIGQTIETVDKQTIKADVIGKQVQLIDVRTAEEYGSGHIDHAVNYNINNGDTFLIQIQKPDKNKPVYLYCKMGGRSNKAAKLLKEQGFKKVFDYSGGYVDWILE
jgi:rhodanese-related sulfurtransferase